MAKTFLIYATHPNGENRIFEVEESGGFYDASKVIHDERIDGPMPDIFLNEFQALLDAKAANAAVAKQASDASRTSALNKIALANGLTAKEVAALFPQELS